MGRRHRDRAIAALLIVVAGGCSVADETTESSTPTPSTASVPKTVHGGLEPADRERLRDELDSAEERWAASGPDSYSFTFAVRGFWARTEVGVDVVDGAIVALHEPDDVRDIPSQRTVEDWFERIGTLVDEAYFVEVEYGDRGHPVRIVVDEDAWVVDEEWWYEAVALEP